VIPAFAATTTLGACGLEVVVVAYVDAGADGGGGTGAAGTGGAGTGDVSIGSSTGGGAGGDGGGSPAVFDCETSADCATGDFCAKGTCDAPLGLCEHRPFACGAVVEPSCGCDGVNYLNDCLRRSNGIAASEPGECKTGNLACSPSTPCPSAAVCAILLPGLEQNCEPKETGACWVVPADCGPPGPGDRFDSCDGTVTCLSPCRAIKAATPHRRSKDCGN
jgi:hypothetical protein